MTRAKGKGRKRAALPKELRGKGPVPAPTRRDPSGKVHLLVQQDPASGSARVELSAPLFEEPWQNDVASSAASTAYLALNAGVDVERVVALTRHTMDLASKLADGLIDRAANGSVACQPGCDHCCHQSVGVTPAEAITIIEHVRRTFSDEQRQELAERLQHAHERTRGLTSTQRFSPKHPCPFLDSGRCSIYDVRPLTCRGVNSLDADECRRELRDAKTRAAFLRSGVGGRAFLEPIRATHAVSAGVQLGLSELFGLDMQPLDLTAAAHALLNGGESIPDEWIAGHTPLEAARGGECVEDATSRALRGARS